MNIQRPPPLANSSGYFEATITTNNLPLMLIAVYYYGEPVRLKLKDVNITFSGKAF